MPIVAAQTDPLSTKSISVLLERDVAIIEVNENLWMECPSNTGFTHFFEIDLSNENANFLYSSFLTAYTTKKPIRLGYKSSTLGCWDGVYKYVQSLEF